MPDLRVQNWHGREVVPESGLNKDTLKEVRDERKLATEEGYPNYARQVREYLEGLKRSGTPWNRAWDVCQKDIPPPRGIPYGWGRDILAPANRITGEATPLRFLHNVMRAAYLNEDD